MWLVYFIEPLEDRTALQPIKINLVIFFASPFNIISVKLSVR